MNKVFNFIGSKNKVEVAQLIEETRLAPSKIMGMSHKGISFLGFDDWLRVASKATLPTPYASFWRSLALSYPEGKGAKDFELFFNVLKDKPLLADQARAYLFMITAKKLPSLNKLKKIIAEDKEQARVKDLIIQKKSLGDAEFLKRFHSSLVKEKDGQINFPIENGGNTICFPISEQKRMLTIYGMGTIISIVHHKDDDGATAFHHAFLLIDGEPFVRKEGLSKLENILVK